MNRELLDILFLDIETIACTDAYDSLDERLKTQWARKASFFKQRDPQSTDEEVFHERAGIYAEFGKIIVIGLGKFSYGENGELLLKTRALADHDERKILDSFKTILEKMEAGASVKLCAHNGREFDFPYLSRRLLLNDLSLPSVLSLSGKRPWEIPHLDTMELWKFGDFKHYTSLDLLTAIFNIPTSKKDMDGSQVNQVYYKEKNIDRISAYCVADVVAVAQLYLRMKGLPLVLPDHIIAS